MSAIIDPAKLKEYSDKRGKDGFLYKMYTHICAKEGQDTVDAVTRLRDDYEQLVEFVFNLKTVEDVVQVKESYSGKNAAESKIKKEYGNEAYKEGKDLAALYHYTEAVMSAPAKEDGKSKELAIALANRSAVLFGLKMFSEALDDIALALDSGYPEELAYKLYERRAKIEIYFKQILAAIDSYKKALNYLEKAKKLTAERKKKVQMEIQKGLSIIQNAPADFLKNDQNVKIRGDPDLPNISRNPLYPAVSDAVSFKYEAGRGRFAVASRNLRLGEVVALERPIVSGLLPEYMAKNCSHCYTTMRAPLPCPTCSKVMFCSYECRAKALASYHRYECKLSQFFISAGMSAVALLAYRTITQKPLAWFKQNKHKFMDYDQTSGQSKAQEDVYESEDYRNYFNLVTHHKDMDVANVFHRAIFAAFLLKCLQSQGYFPSHPQAALGEDEKFVGGLLMHFLEVLQFNSHEIAEFEMQGREFSSSGESVFIGAAVYPTVAMLNHACDPGVVRYYVKDWLVVRAIRGISQGEEICENYGPIFFSTPRSSRRERLAAQYWFQCECRACAQDWPLMLDMDTQTFNLRCEMCGDCVPHSATSNLTQLKCGCGSALNLMKIIKALADTEGLAEKADDKAEDGNVEEAQKIYMDNLEKLEQLLCPPFQDYYKLQQKIWKCLWVRFGNKAIVGGNKVPAKQNQDNMLD